MSLTLAEVDRDYIFWLENKACRSGRDTFHPIHDNWDVVCFLGGCDISSGVLAEANVSHILSVISKSRGQAVTGAEGEFERHIIDLDDVFDADIASHFERAFAFLDQAAANGCGCYVHCELGRSRSATIVIGWLMHRRAMRREGVSLLECWAAVARTRRISALNLGFFTCLCDLEARLSGGARSMSPLDYVRLPLLDRTQFAYTPVPSVAELVEESRKDASAEGENAPAAGRREEAIRKMMRQQRYVLDALKPTSVSAQEAVRVLVEGF